MKTIENTYISWVPKNHVIRELGRSSHSRPVTHSSCDMTALVEAGRPNWEGKHGKIGETLWFSLMFILKVGSCFSATSCCNNWFIWGILPMGHSKFIQYAGGDPRFSNGLRVSLWDHVAHVGCNWNIFAILAVHFCHGIIDIRGLDL